LEYNFVVGRIIIMSDEKGKSYEVPEVPRGESTSGLLNEERDEWYIEKKGLVAVMANRDSRCDSVCAAIAYAELRNAIAGRSGSEAKYIACRAGELSRATTYALKKLDFEPPMLFFDLGEMPGGRDAKVVLIGHNDLRNAADGIIPAQISEIIDRHPLGGLKSKHIVSMLIEPVGSTSTIVRRLFRDNDVEISERIAALLLVGIVTATAGLTTYTTRNGDRFVAKEMAALAGLDIAELTAEFDEFRPVKQFVALTEEEEPIESKPKKRGRRLWR
jgi:manganese-dependent inorganic pyrophosphatase